MKTCFALLLIATAASAQSLQPVFPNFPITFGKTNIFNTSANTSRISSSKSSRQSVFVIYNTVTGSNDAYVEGSDAPVRSTVLLDNLNRGVKVDSFNPNGASDFGSAIGAGILNFIFNGSTGNSAYIKL